MAIVTRGRQDLGKLIPCSESHVSRTPFHTMCLSDFPFAIPDFPKKKVIHFCSELSNLRPQAVTLKGWRDGGHGLRAAGHGSIYL